MPVNVSPSSSWMKNIVRKPGKLRPKIRASSMVKGKMPNPVKQQNQSGNIAKIFANYMAKTPSNNNRFGNLSEY